MMDNSTNAGGFLGSSNLGGFGYGIGVSVGVLLLNTTITFASYFCTRTQQSSVPIQQRNTGEPTGQQSVVVEEGLDEATLTSCPMLLYSEAKLHKADTTARCCSICLADCKNTDTLRLLPDCGHLFHLKCVDPWLRLQPTCPVCRTSPLPTPLPTPLVDVVPLSSRQH